MNLITVLFILLFGVMHPQPSLAQTACIQGDANGDGKVTLADFAVWRSIYLANATSPTPTAVPGISPTIPPSTSPSPTPGTSPSGEAMPLGNLTGWKQIFTEDFTQNATVGNFPGTAYATKWGYYPDGWEDTAGKMGSPSQYFTTKVVSVQNGVLNKHLHFEDGTFMASALVPQLTATNSHQLYGKFSVRFRAVNGAAGYKTAWLMWPESEQWPDDGEIDFPEGDLNSTIAAFHHYAQPAGMNPFQDAFITNKTYATWHTASTEWKPGRIEFFLDGQSIGVTTTKVPSKPMRWVLQTESCLGGCPSQTATSDVQIDWVTAYSYNP